MEEKFQSEVKHLFENVVEGTRVTTIMSHGRCASLNNKPAVRKKIFRVGFEACTCATLCILWD